MLSGELYSLAASNLNSALSQSSSAASVASPTGLLGQPTVESCSRNKALQALLVRCFAMPRSSVRQLKSAS